MLDNFRFVSRKVDLNGAGHKEIVVWLPGYGWGGSSGYGIFIFSQTEKGYRKLWHIDQSWTPIILLKSKNHGWHNIAYQFGGGGVDWQYAFIKFDGKKYRYQ